jgi:zinc and cadmium transporter
MEIIHWIIISTILGSLISICLSGLFAMSANPSQIQKLVSLAIGTLLGATFLEVIPHAIERSQNVKSLFLTILGGILLFFILEKFVLWRHCHVEECEGHEHLVKDDHGRSGTMILIGDSFHNFVDGVLIAAAYITDIKLGVITTLAITAHEIPQEVGDFLILLNSGFAKLKAFTFNLVSSGATLIGALLAYFAFDNVEFLIPTFLGLAASSMIYVAVADLIPGLHKRTEIAATVEQVVLILIGILIIFSVGHFIHV